MSNDVPARITCALFDMDGVLVDVSQSYRIAIAATAESFTGQPVPPGLIQELKDRGGFNDDWELTDEIIRRAGVAADYDDVVRAFQQKYRGPDWDGLIAKETPLISNHVLEALIGTGIELGVVTGRPEEEARWTIEHFGWTGIFGVLVAREQQGDRPKPDGYPLEAALIRLSRTHRPNGTVYVGDTVDDMHAAVHAGVIPVGFVPPYLDAGQHGELLRRHGARLVISDYDSFLSVLDV